MFKTRLASGIILVIAAVLLIGAGGIICFFASLVLSLIAAGELFMATKVRDKGLFGPLDLAAYIGIVIYYLGIYFTPRYYWLMYIVADFMIVAFVFVITYPRYTAYQMFSAFGGIIYTGVLFSCVYLTGSLTDGWLIVWLIILASWGSDTFAYCTGMLFGKHKMAPVLSPKKSIEGAVGGILGAALLGWIYALVFHGPVLTFVIICTAGAVIAMFGDLTASGIKRSMGIKDYGKLIPGHGGILDRFDSVIFTAPVIYFMASLFIGI